MSVPEVPEISDIGELLPHARPMMLLDEVLAADDESLRCALTVRADGLFDSDSSVPAYLGLEYMAQAIAAYSGARAHQAGAAPRIGFLLGTRNFSCNTGRLPCGTRLEVTARCTVQSASGMAAFDCEVRGEGIFQSARLSVFEPADSESFMQQGDVSSEPTA